MKSTNPADTLRVVVVGQAHSTLSDGQSKTVQLELDPTGQQLLTKRGRLQTTLTVTQPGAAPIHSVITFHSS